MLLHLFEASFYNELCKRATAKDTEEISKCILYVIWPIVTGKLGGPLHHSDNILSPTTTEPHLISGLQDSGNFKFYEGDFRYTC